MTATATISIMPISNGFIVSDAANDLYGGSEWRVAESVHYASLDDLAADAPRFVRAAVEGAIEREQELRERLAAEQAEMGGIRSAAMQQRVGGSIGGFANNSIR